MAIAILLVATSCNSGKEYKYIQVNMAMGQFASSAQEVEEEPVAIIASSDSEAYVKAYEKFCISQRVYLDVANQIDMLQDIPVYFKLLSPKGENIANIEFQNKDTIEASIRRRIESLDGTAKIDNAAMKDEAPAIDSTAVKELSRYFNINKDEFDKNGKAWYIPKSAPKYTNANGIFCYFEVVNGKADNFRFKIQYHADDWLFIQRVQFSIDGNAYEYIPLNMETDSGNGGFIWEWFDENVRSSDIPLIEALANAKDAKMKLQGRQYFDIKKISKDQILNIKRSLALYKALGGSF